MRIRVVTASDPANDGIARKTSDQLAKEIEHSPTAVLTAENPDVIHIIGAWDTPSTSIAKEATRKSIAVVHTPLGSLSPWYKPATIHMKLSAGLQAVVASGMMEQELLDDATGGNLRLILNCVTTNTTTPSEMASAYLSVYEEATASTTGSIWKAIDSKMSLIGETDESIIAICRELLYAQYLHKRNNIPRRFIDSLSELMTKSDYDEDHMADLLKLLSLYDFTQRLEYAMQEKSTLTEGFMPIPPLDDKGAKDMVNYITDYEDL